MNKSAGYVLYGIFGGFMAYVISYFFQSGVVKMMVPISDYIVRAWRGDGIALTATAVGVLVGILIAHRRAA